MPKPALPCFGVHRDPTRCSNKSRPKSAIRRRHGALAKSFRSQSWYGSKALSGELKRERRIRQIASACSTEREIVHHRDMAAKTSSQVLAWQKAERFLHTALVGEQGRRVTEELSQRVPESAAFHAAREGMALLLRAQIGDLVEKDDQVFKVEARLATIKGQRDRCKAELSDLIVSIRRVLNAIYKAPGLERLGLEGRTGRTVEHLLRQAGRLSAAADKDLTPILGESRFNEGLDPRPQMRRIGQKAKALEALAEQLDEARRDRDEVGVDRNLALDEYKKAHLATTQTFEAWCRLAGEEILAEKVRDARLGRRKRQAPPAEEAQGWQRSGGSQALLEQSVQPNTPLLKNRRPDPWAFDNASKLKEADIGGLLGPQASGGAGFHVAVHRSRRPEEPHPLYHHASG